MAAGIGIGLSIMGGRQQRKAGRMAAAAGEAGAQSILEETAENIKQAKKSQAQTIGMAKAITAASGVKFDAAKIGEVEFAEGPTADDEKGGVGGAISQVMQKVRGEAGDDGGGLVGRLLRNIGQPEEEVEPEPEAGTQLAGEAEGSSAFIYLREMKKTFAEDIGWMGEQGRSRARVARMGGQIAYAQAKAGEFASYAGAAGQAYSWWKE